MIALLIFNTFQFGYKILFSVVPLVAFGNTANGHGRAMWWYLQKVKPGTAAK
jgi:hypothetical protein